jgi:hypothetical protein
MRLRICYMNANGLGVFCVYVCDGIIDISSGST